MSLINKIFFANNRKEKFIFIKLGKKCLTKCPGCAFGTEKNNDFFDVGEILKNIIVFDQLIDENFSYFLYGGNSLDYSNIDKLLGYIGRNNRKIVIQIALDNLKKTESELNGMNEKYKNVTFLVSTNVYSRKELESKLNLINDFTTKGFQINFDIITKISHYHEIIKNFLFTCNHVRKDNLHKNIYFKKGNIEGTISNNIQIDINSGLIKGIPYNSCVMRKFFSIKAGKILLSSHIEVNLNGSLTFHTPICYLGKIEISHMNKTSDEILSDFKDFEQNFVNDKSNNMASECYKCIKGKGYKYK